MPELRPVVGYFGPKYMSTKTYPHTEGLSCVFRQHAAKGHCSRLHGYALEVSIAFGCNELDANGWVQDFGALAELRAWLRHMFDHTLLAALDDPHVGDLRRLEGLGLAQVRYVERTGCEAFAKMIADAVPQFVRPGVFVVSVQVKEHAGNSALYVPGAIHSTLLEDA